MFVSVEGAQRVIVCGFLTMREQLIGDKEFGNGCAENIGTVYERLRVTCERLRGHEAKRNERYERYGSPGEIVTPAVT